MSLKVVLLVAQWGTLACAIALGGPAKKAASSNLLQAIRHVSVDGSDGSATSVDGSKQQPDGFFTKDFEKMDELPNAEKLIQKVKQCHPKCRWNCGTSKCNTKCEPRCAAPKCVTACAKPTMAKCKRVCKDPQCAVVCPSQCEHGTCPTCKTVCGASVCNMECGEGRCESTCADPDCTWDCKADAACQQPDCKMKCDNAACTFGKEQKLPNANEVQFTGHEIAWKGLGKVPAEHLAEFAPKSFEKVQLPTGAKMFGGAKLAK